MAPDPVHYYLVRERTIGDFEADFKKIIDYLLTFVGDVSVIKERDNAVVISYTETPLKATLTKSRRGKDTAISSQMTLTCERNDNLSVNLIKNVTGNIGYRIFNLQTGSFLANDPNLMDLTTVRVEPEVAVIFDKYKLTPLFQFRNSLVFIAKDKKGKIYLVNRHLLEHLSQEPNKSAPQKDFSVEIAPDIGRFIALFDRGLIPLSFYENYNQPTKIVNQSGFNPDRFERKVYIEPVLFVFDKTKQSFTQLEITRRDLLPKGYKLNNYIRKVVNSSKLKKKLMAAKISREISYIPLKGKLIPRLRLSLFLDK